METGSAPPAAAPQPAGPAPDGYLVSYDVDYAEKRSRLTTFFRVILAIPQLIVLTVLQAVAFVLVVISWFAIMITGRYPRGMFDFFMQIFRWFANVYAYLLLLRDEYPPFSGNSGKYPLTLEVAYPQDGRMSRVKTLFRLVLMYPLMFIVYPALILLEFVTFQAWIVIVITGRYPKGMFDLAVGANRLANRANAYVLLLTDKYPPYRFGQ